MFGISYLVFSGLFVAAAGSLDHVTVFDAKKRAVGSCSLKPQQTGLKKHLRNFLQVCSERIKINKYYTKVPKIQSDPLAFIFLGTF